MVENVASERVAQRAGFQLEGTWRLDTAMLPAVPMLRRTVSYRMAKSGLLAFQAHRRYQPLRARARTPSPPSEDEWNGAHEATARDIHDLTVELEGVYIKLCQAIGSRGDIFPEPYTRILGRFLDKVPPRPFAEIEAAVRKELRRPISEVFEHVDETPLAAASLAQVHRARLRDGTEVALKVQYPEVARLVRADLRAVRIASDRFIPKSNVFDPQNLIDEGSHFLDLELDFTREADSTERVRREFEDDARIRVPRVHRELSTGRLLVLEYLEGIPLTDLERLRESGADLRAIAENVGDLFAKMIFEHGFFHGDPHPGNVLILPGDVVGLLDFGLAKELPNGFAASMADLVAKSTVGDDEGALEAARDLGFNLDEVTPELLDQIVQQVFGEPREPPRRGERRPRAERRARRRERREHLEALAEGGEPIRMPHHFTLVARAVMLLDGLSHQLTPGESVIQEHLQDALAPYTRRALREYRERFRADGDDPYAAYRTLRRRSPVLRPRRGSGPIGGAPWVITAHAPAEHVLRDTRFSSADSGGRRRQTVGDDDNQSLLGVTMLNVDPPEHTRLRGIVSKAFTPRRIAELRSRIEGTVDELLGGVRPGTHFDVVDTLAGPLPAIVIAELLGVPTEDHARFRGWANGLLGATDPSQVRADGPARELIRYLEGIIAERRREPADDLISAMITAQVESQHLTDAEIRSTALLLLIAGFVTTTNLVGNGVLALLRNPEQLERLRADRALVPSAVEEMLRYDSPVQLIFRTASEPLDVQGHEIPTGDGVVVLLGAANRDPQAFENPDTFDIGRGDRTHLGFGWGIHHCLGAPLARLEAQVAFEVLLDRFSNWKLGEGGFTRQPNPVLRGLSRLDLVV